MPEGWKASRARVGSPSTTAGKPTQAPAGRPPNRAAGVAGVSEDNLFPALDSASVSALAQLDDELSKASEERYVEQRPPKRLIINLKHGDTNLRGLVDTGAEINLMTESAARITKLPIRESDRPTTINLALDNKDTSPILLRLNTSASLTDPDSGLIFKEIPFIIGPITGQYDMILGAPFLSLFSLSVSMSNKSLRCDTTGRVISDYRLLLNDMDRNKKSESTTEHIGLQGYPCEQIERNFLQEFCDIPAVSDATEEEGLFTDGSFPEKIQDVNSKIRHKIILKDPNVVFNERQYPYPQKYLTAWRTLYDQHLSAGRI
jgi:hypothetical protein